MSELCIDKPQNIRRIFERLGACNKENVFVSRASTTKSLGRRRQKV